MYNLLIGGAAGQGIETTAGILEKLLKRSGYCVFTVRDVMSRIRGGHNFSLIRFGAEEIHSHSPKIDGILALNDETVPQHLSELKPDGFILCDEGNPESDPRIIKIALSQIAKNLGNPKVSGSVALGAVLKMFGEPIQGAEKTLSEFIKPDYLDINLKALEAGYNNVEQRYDHLDGSFSDHIILSGSKAIALGAMAAGLQFYTAYPMSPSTPIMEYLATKMDEFGIVVEQAEDEIAAVNMAIGASYAGVRSMTGTSGGGFSLMVEGLGLSGMTEIPVVMIDMQRPGPVTGFPTRTEQSDLKFVISASQGEFPRMVIALRDQEDAFYQTQRAFNLADKYQIPVILLGDQYLGDSSATVKPFNLQKISRYVEKPITKSDGEYLRYQITENGISPRLIPGDPKGFAAADSDEHTERGWITESAELRTQMMDKRMRKLTKLQTELEEPRFLGNPNCTALLLGWGSTYGAIAEAIHTLNQNSDTGFGALVFGDIWPLPTRLLNKYASRAGKIINIEQNATGQLGQLIREQTGIVCDSSILKYDGRQITGEEIAERVEELYPMPVGI